MLLHRLYLSKAFGMWRSPPRCLFFFGPCSWIKILTLNHLQSRGWNLANRCILCMEEELVNHLFIYCSMTKGGWDFFLSHLKIPWIFLDAFNKLISVWWISGFEGFPLSIWCVIPSDICWGLWKEQNSRIFEEKLLEAKAIWFYSYTICFSNGLLCGGIMRIRGGR